MSDPVANPRTANVIRSPKAANRRAEVRDRLQDRGARLFAEHGRSNVSVEDLINAVGISRATLLRLYQPRHDFGTVYRESILALLLKD